MNGLKQKPTQGAKNLTKYVEQVLKDFGDRYVIDFA
jgi:hypothetical protein